MNFFAQNAVGEFPSFSSQPWYGQRGARTVCLGQNACQKHREDTASCFDFAGGRKILHRL